MTIHQTGKFLNKLLDAKSAEGQFPLSSHKYFLYYFENPDAQVSSIYGRKYKRHMRTL